MQNIKVSGLPYITDTNRTSEKEEMHLEGISGRCQAHKEANPAERFYVVGKQVLQSNRNFYIVDLGLRNHILPRRRYNLGFSLENIVYFELLFRGYQVWVDKCGNTEVDFVAKKESVYTYYQVTADMSAEETFERELRPLRNIRDNYEKIILTTDYLTLGNYDGIQVKNLLEWLLDTE